MERAGRKGGGERKDKEGREKGWKEGRKANFVFLARLSLGFF